MAGLGKGGWEVFFRWEMERAQTGSAARAGERGSWLGPTFNEISVH